VQVSLICLPIIIYPPLWRHSVTIHRRVISSTVPATKITYLLFMSLPSASALMSASAAAIDAFTSVGLSAPDYSQDIQHYVKHQHITLNNPSTRFWNKQAFHGLWSSAGLKMTIHADCFRRTILTRKVGKMDLVFGMWSGFISWSVHRDICNLTTYEITSLCVQRLWFVPPWLTSRHTHRQHFHYLIWKAQVSRVKSSICIHDRRSTLDGHHKCLEQTAS